MGQLIVRLRLVALDDTLSYSSKRQLWSPITGRRISMIIVMSPLFPLIF